MVHLTEEKQFELLRLRLMTAHWDQVFLKSHGHGGSRVHWLDKQLTDQDILLLNKFADSAQLKSLIETLMTRRKLEATPHK